MTTSRDLLDALERDLIRRPEHPTGLFLTEIEAPSGRRRADALWMPGGVRSGDINGYEIKVDLRDLDAELADPTKAEPWQRYCKRWWLVVAPEIAEATLARDIPDSWGAMTMPKHAGRRQMQVLREAPVLRSENVGPVLSKLAMWATWKQLAWQRDRMHLLREVEHARARQATLAEHERMRSCARRIR